MLSCDFSHLKWCVHVLDHIFSLSICPPQLLFTCALKGTCLFLLCRLHLFTTWSNRLFAWLISWWTTAISILEKYISAVDVSKDKGMCGENYSVPNRCAPMNTVEDAPLETHASMCTLTSVPLCALDSILLPSTDMKKVCHQIKRMPGCGLVGDT